MGRGGRLAPEGRPAAVYPVAAMHAYPAHRPIDDWAATISKPNG